MTARLGDMLRDVGERQQAGAGYAYAWDRLTTLVETIEANLRAGRHELALSVVDRVRETLVDDPAQAPEIKRPSPDIEDTHGPHD